MWPRITQLLVRTHPRHRTRRRRRPAPDAPDVKVKDYDLHDDAVVAVAWSSCDAWVFASLSFDGRVLLNHVPSPEKYRILL